MSEHKHIMVYSDSTKDNLLPEAKELLGGARRLADAVGEEVICLLVGTDAESIGKQAIGHGADRVICISFEFEDRSRDEIRLQILEELVRKYLPRVLLMSQKDVDLATWLGFKIGTGVCTDCVKLEIDQNSKQVMHTRSVYGGAARGLFASRRSPQISSVRAKVLSALEHDDSRQGSIETVKMTIDQSNFKTRKIGEVKEEAMTARVENASIIVCGGRGLGGPEPFASVLKELADALGGVVGSSRPPADNGWVSKALHIGLTGKIVAPSLYIAIGVSGASQHMAGCSGSKTIVAINKDPEANIFKECDYGIVGFYEEIVPALTKEILQLKSTKTH